MRADKLRTKMTKRFKKENSTHFKLILRTFADGLFTNRVFTCLNVRHNSSSYHIPVSTLNLYLGELPQSLAITYLPRCGTDKQERKIANIP